MFVAANTTCFAVECFTAQDKECRKRCVVVLRATFDVDPDGTCRIAEPQSPFVYADAHYGDPETTSVRAESDFAPVKPRAEILLDAVAMAPGGGTAERVEVALLGTSIDKRAIVVGERHWTRGPLGVVATRPAPFRKLPLAWHLAFGGTDASLGDGERGRSDAVNPVGRGYHRNPVPASIEGVALPCIEDPRSPIAGWSDRPPPVGFGPVPRFAAARARFAGTYDQHWMDHVLPFLPSDFDERYFQAAPADQQVDRLAEGTGFACINMSPSGTFRVRLPSLSVPVRFVFDNRTEGGTILPDTLILEPHHARIVLIGRTSLPLPRKFTRLREVRVGSLRVRSGAA
jgi:hypothetical protein